MIVQNIHINLIEERSSLKCFIWLRLIVNQPGIFLFVLRTYLFRIPCLQVSLTGVSLAVGVDFFQVCFHSTDRFRQGILGEASCIIDRVRCVRHACGLFGGGV